MGVAHVHFVLPIRNPSLACVLLVLAACSSSSNNTTHASASAPAALALTTVAWNPANVDVGAAEAVVEIDKSLLVLGSKGIVTLVSGAVVTTDGAITTWKSAAQLPSPDGQSTWVVGVDGNGVLQRMSIDGSPANAVSDRYGLAMDKVQDVAGGAPYAGFMLATGVAVTDGANVTRYQGTAKAIAAHGNAVALADGVAVRVFDGGKESDVTLPDAQLVAYDQAGDLLAATPHRLYQVTAGAAELLYDAGDRTIHQLAGAGSNIWFSVDSDLGVFRAATVMLASGGTLPVDARLVGSPSGDVWTLTGGHLSRMSAGATGDGGASGDEASWNTTIQPIYAAVCSNCHSPAGSGKDSSGIDLSTYATWSARREHVYTRTVTQAGTATSMPPPGAPIALTDAQRAAIAAWAKP